MTNLFHTVAAEEASSRRKQMLRTAFGPTIAAALADPTVLEVMLNPDGRLLIDRASEGRRDTGEQIAVVVVDGVDGPRRRHVGEDANGEVLGGVVGVGGLEVARDGHGLEAIGVVVGERAVAADGREAVRGPNSAGRSRDSTCGTRPQFRNLSRSRPGQWDAPVMHFEAIINRQQEPSNAALLVVIISSLHQSIVLFRRTVGLQNRQQC